MAVRPALARHRVDGHGVVEHEQLHGRALVVADLPRGRRSVVRGTTAVLNVPSAAMGVVAIGAKPAAVVALDRHAAGDAGATRPVNT